MGNRGRAKRVEGGKDHESRAIHVSGLSADVIRVLESLVALPRRKEERAVPSISIFDLFGKAPKLRTAEDISRQTSEERGAYGGD